VAPFSATTRQPVDLRMQRSPARSLPYVLATRMKPGLAHTRFKSPAPAMQQGWQPLEGVHPVLSPDCCVCLSSCPYARRAQAQQVNLDGEMIC
jgi:hypothetical protein